MDKKEGLKIEFQVKTKKHDISIRELFRDKLEYAEILPDPAVSSKLMQRVARKEFMRFNPARFNIYYLGGILIIGITAAVLLLSVPGKTTRPDPVPVSNKSDSSSSGNYLEVSALQPVRKETDKLKSNSNESIKRSPLQVINKESAKVMPVAADSNLKGSLQPAGTDNS